MGNIIKIIVYSGLAIAANLVGAKCGSKVAETIKNIMKNDK
jgi:hypothetical protein